MAEEQSNPTPMVAVSSTVSKVSDSASGLISVSTVSAATQKPGYKTSEFWLTVIAMTVSLIVASGLVVEGTNLSKALALASAVLSSLGYTVSRGMAKGKQ